MKEQFFRQSGPLRAMMEGNRREEERRYIIVGTHVVVLIGAVAEGERRCYRREAQGFRAKTLAYPQHLAL